MAQYTEEAYRYRWVILIVLWTTYLVVFLNRLSVGPLAPFFKEELEISNAQVGLVMSAAAIGYVVTQFPTGWVVDRIGARWPLSTGTTIAGISMVALFFVPSYTWLLVLMFATGMGCGFLQPSTTQGVIIWFPQRERATVMSLKQTAVNIGGMITAVTLPAVAIALGWRFGFLFLGIIAIAIGVIAFIFYKEPPSQTVLNPQVSANSPTAVPMLDILKNRDIWLVSIAALLLAWVEFTTIAHLVLYLKEVLIYPVVLAGGLLAMVEAAGAIGRPGIGFISDRVYRGKRKSIFILLAIVASTMCLILGLLGPYLVSWLLYFILFLLGIAAIGWGGIYLTLVSELGGRHGAGKAAGMSASVGTCGIIIGPPVFGYIVDLTGSYALAWSSLSFVAALCVLLLFFVNEDKRKI
ncbi:MFS transporter [Chloroflexota bacterium]